VCWDNAAAESFFAALKNEMYYRQFFATRARARFAVAEYIEVLSRYAGDPLPDRWDRGGRVTASIGGPWWGSSRVFFASLDPVAVS